MAQLLIVGSVAFDAIETPFDRTDRILGGAASFIALAASQFDASLGVVSVVGNDFPDAYLQLFRDRNVDISGLEVVPDGKTFFWHGRYHNDMNTRDTLVTELNTLGVFEPKVPDHFRRSDVVMLGNLHPEVQGSVLDQLSERPKFVALDTMNYWIENTPNELADILARVDAVLINDEEARQLTGEYSLVKAAARVRQMGPNYVVIKKGEHGALLFHDESVFFAPALPLEAVFDPTGAGDTFAGGFVGYLAQSRNLAFDNLKNAVVHGSNLASFCVERFGTERMLELDRETARRRLRQFTQLTQFNIELL